MDGVANVSSGGKEKNAMNVSLDEDNEKKIIEKDFLIESSHGKQVIALGCVVAFLILLFYGLQIGRKIYKKRKGQSELTKQ